MINQYGRVIAHSRPQLITEFSGLVRCRDIAREKNKAEGPRLCEKCRFRGGYALPLAAKDRCAKLGHAMDGFAISIVMDLPEPKITRIHGVCFPTTRAGAPKLYHKYGLWTDDYLALRRSGLKFLLPRFKSRYFSVSFVLRKNSFNLKALQSKGLPSQLML